MLVPARCLLKHAHSTLALTFRRFLGKTSSSFFGTLPGPSAPIKPNTLINCTTLFGPCLA